MAPTMFKAVAASALVAVANAHGAMVTPCVPSPSSFLRLRSQVDAGGSRCRCGLLTRRSFRSRSRNSVDWKVNVNTQRCANVTEGANGKCENGQASFW